MKALRLAFVAVALAFLPLVASAHGFRVLPSADEMAPACGDKLNTDGVGKIVEANGWRVAKKIAGADLQKFFDFVAVRYNTNRSDMIDADELWVVESPDVADAYLLLWFKEGCLVGKVAVSKDQFNRDYADAFPVQPLPRPGQNELMGYEPYCQRHAALRPTARKRDPAPDAADCLCW